MKPRNPIARVVTRIKPKVVEDKRKKEPRGVEEFMKDLFSDPEIKTVYDRLKDR